MKKKINIGFTISEHVKMIFEKLARDRNLSKSELAEQIILSYFDAKKEEILLEKIDDTIQKLDEEFQNLSVETVKNFKDCNYKLDLIIDKLGDFELKKLAKEFAKEFTNLEK